MSIYISEAEVVVRGPYKFVEKIAEYDILTESGRLIKAGEKYVERETLATVKPLYEFTAESSDGFKLGDAVTLRTLDHGLIRGFVAAIEDCGKGMVKVGLVQGEVK